MKRIRILGLSILAVFALSAIVATAAQAKGGPFLKIGGVRLAETQTEEITGKAQTSFVLTAVGDTITCTGLKLEKSKIIGSSGLNSSTSEETIVFEGCSLKGNGANKNEGECQLTAADKGIIKTEPVKNTLDYPQKVPVKGDVLLVLFQPVKGSVFVKIKVEAIKPGACLVEGTLAVEGSTLGFAQNELKESFKLKENVKETEIGLVHFPSKASESCTEKEGVVTCLKHKLTLATKTAELSGSAGITLASKKVWGVLSE